MSVFRENAVALYRALGFEDRPSDADLAHIERALQEAHDAGVEKCAKLWEAPYVVPRALSAPSFAERSRALKLTPPDKEQG